MFNPFSGYSSSGLLIVGLLVVLVVLTVVGMLVFIKRRLRRDRDLPICGQCGYAVRGVQTLICPECGSDLREVGIIAAGKLPNWRPWPGAVTRFTLWTLLFLIGGSVIGSVIDSYFVPEHVQSYASVDFAAPSTSPLESANIAQRKTVYRWPIWMGIAEPGFEVPIDVRVFVTGGRELHAQVTPDLQTHRLLEPTPTAWQSRPLDAAAVDAWWSQAGLTMSNPILPQMRDELLTGLNELRLVTQLPYPYNGGQGDTVLGGPGVRGFYDKRGPMVGVGMDRAGVPHAMFVLVLVLGAVWVWGGLRIIRHGTLSKPASLADEEAQPSLAVEPIPAPVPAAALPSAHD